MAPKDSGDREPAILFVESPRSVCGLDRKYFADIACRKLIIVDEDESTEVYFSENDLVISCSLHDERALEAVYLRLEKEFRVTAVLGFSETAVFASAYLSQAFEVSGIGLEAAEACRNKSMMMSLLAKGGVRVPASFVVLKYDDLTEMTLSASVTAIGGFPVVCKPLMGFASNGVIRTDSSWELVRAIRRIRRINKAVMAKFYAAKESLDQVLVQAFIPGEEIAVDGYMQGTKATVVTIIDKPGVSQGPYFKDGLHILPSKISDELAGRVKDVVQKSVLSLGLRDTPFHLEARIAEGEIYVLEVAARIGFAHSIRDALGCDICTITLGLKTGSLHGHEPTRHRFAGNFCITPETMGTFLRINNTDEILEDPNIVALPLFVQSGDRVAVAPEGNAYIGYILAAADSYEEVESTLASAVQKLEVIIE